MIWHRRHHACGIVKLASNNEKRLYVFGGYHGGWRLGLNDANIELLNEIF